MFKRGGSSFQAQGTGITSPYDTPRKRYAEGPTWEEINKRRSGLYNPRSDLSFAMEGFSALGNPYKDDGSAKTIGEMLYEGAGQVRKSRAADKSIPRQISELTENIIKIASTNRGNPGSEFELAGYAQGIAQGLVTINNMQGGEEVVTAMVIPSSAFKKIEGKWDYDVASLAGGMVYWDPMTQKWLIVENAQTADAKEIYFDSYEEAKGGLTVKKSEENKSKKISSDPDSSPSEIKNNEIKMKIVTNLKDVDINDESVIFDEAAKIGIKIVSSDGSKTWLQNLAENEMSIFAFKEILKQKKMSDTYGHVSSNKAKRGDVFDQVTEEIKVAENMAGGGRAGYASGTEPDDLSELTSWWKSEVDNSFNS